VTRSVRAATCHASDIKKVAKAFARSPLDHFNHGPHDYRGYLGEYPRRRPYVHRLEDPITFGGKDGYIEFQHLTLRQLRGGEWERDYSQLIDSKTTLMPSIALVYAGNLRWDHCGGWQDSNAEVQVQDPWWWSEEPAGLICRTAYMDHFLETNHLALIILGYQEKFIAGISGGGGRLTECTLFIRHRSKTKLVERNLARD